MNKELNVLRQQDSVKSNKKKELKKMSKKIIRLEMEKT